jgi:hypothetical protein
MARSTASGRLPATRSTSAAGRKMLFPRAYDNFVRANGALGNLDSGQAWVENNWAIISTKATNAPTLSTTMLTNGTFTTDTTGWTAVGATIASVAGGTSGTNCLQVTNSGAAKGYCYQALTTVVGSWYRAEVSYKNGTASSTLIGIGPDINTFTLWDKSGLSSASFTGRAAYFQATTTTTYITLGVNTTTATNTMLYDASAFQELTTLADIPATIDNGCSNADITIKYARGQNAQGGIILNLDSQTAPTNFVYAVVSTAGDSNNKVVLYKYVNGAYTKVAEAAQNIAAVCSLRVTKVGTTYKVYYEGVLMITAEITDTSITSNTKHGMWMPDSQATISFFSAGDAPRNLA